MALGILVSVMAVQASYAKSREKGQSGTFGACVSGAYGLSYTKTALGLENNSSVLFVGADGAGGDAEVNYALTDHLTVGISGGYASRARKWNTSSDAVVYYSSYVVTPPVTTVTRDGQAGYYPALTGSSEISQTYIPALLNLRFATSLAGLSQSLDAVRPFAGFGVGYFNPGDQTFKSSSAGPTSYKDRDGKVTSSYDTTGTSDSTIKFKGTLGYTGEIGIGYAVSDSITLFAGVRAVMVSFRPASGTTTTNSTYVSKSSAGVTTSSDQSTSAEDTTYADTRQDRNIPPTGGTTTTTTTVGKVTTSVTNQTYANGDTYTSTTVTDTSGTYPVSTSTSKSVRTRTTPSDTPLDSLEVRAGVAMRF